MLLSPGFKPFRAVGTFRSGQNASAPCRLHIKSNVEPWCERERERERKRARERERERERERLKLALNMFLTSLLMAAHVLVPVALFTRHIGVSNLAADGGAPCVLQSLLGRKVSGNRPPCSAKHA